MIIVGFSANLMGFAGLSDGTFVGLANGSRFTRDKMQAQELLVDKITEVKRDYYNTQFDGSSSSDPDVLSEISVNFRATKNSAPSTDNMKFDLLIVDPSASASPTTGVQRLNITDVKMNVADLDIDYKPLLVPHDTNKLKYKSDTKLAYFVAELNTENVLPTPQITKLKMTVREGGSVIAHATNDYTVGGKVRYIFSYDQQEDSIPARKKIMSTDITSLRLEEKMEAADAGTKIYYEWFKTKDVTYNVPAGNYYKGTDADNYSLSGSEAQKYKNLFPLFDSKNYSNHYQMIPKRNNKKLKPRSDNDDFQELYGASYIATAKPISSLLVPGETRKSPPVYLGPQYINDDNSDYTLRYLLNASWIDVSKNGADIDRIGGERYLNKVNNFVLNGTYADDLKIKYDPADGRATLLQPDSDELYIRSRYINLAPDGGDLPAIKFPLNPANTYQIIGVVRNNSTSGDKAVLNAKIDGEADMRSAKVFDINLKPVDYDVPVGNENFWHLEYLEVEKCNELKIQDNDSDIAELIVFNGELDLDYRNKLFY